MRILILDQAVPFPPIGGGALRTYHLARALATVHDVTVVGFTFGEAPARPPFRVEVVECSWDWPPLYRQMREGDPVSSALASRTLEDDAAEPWFVSWVASEEMCKTLRRVCQRGVDLVFIEHTCMAWFLSALPPEVPKILDLHNVHTRMSRQLASGKSGADRDRALKEAARTEQFEKRAASQCVLCLTMSDIEADAARNDLDADHVEVLPNGVDPTFFTPSDSPGIAGSLLFTGMMDYGPNVEAVEYFAQRILPLVRREIPEATFHVVGAHPSQAVRALASPSTIVHCFVADVRPHYHDAEVVVVPLLHGGGTRLKILEAAACGKAVVSTSLGAEGLDVHPGKDILVADAPEEFAGAVIRLCRDSALRQRVGRHARRVAEAYGWDAIGTRLCDLVASIGRNHAASGEPCPSHLANGNSALGRGAVHGRVFLVGCPRSGTTLLQSLLTAHPRVASFPESHLFPYLVPDDAEMREAGLASEEARPQWDKFMRDIGRPNLGKRLPEAANTIREYAKTFVGVLDALTLEQGKDWWLEKTPDHIRFLDVIEEHIPGVRFIHLVRNGPDVVASLYEVTRQHPKIWDGPWSIDRCIEKWNEDVGRSLEIGNKPNHLLVRYEELVDQPDAILRGICAFLDIDFRAEMLQEQARAAHSVILSGEVWKLRAAMPVSRTPSSKFDDFFDEEQRAYILGRLLPTEMVAGKGGTACC